MGEHAYSAVSTFRGSLGTAFVGDYNADCHMRVTEA